MLFCDVHHNYHSSRIGIFVIRYHVIMISVNEAISKIQENCPRGIIIRLPIKDALNHILAEDVYSPIDMPPFPQSAMDGYALHIHSESVYELIGETKAGDASYYKLMPGQAIRIFTGGMIPDGANSVAKQEIVSADDKTIKLLSDVSPMENIRPSGEQIRINELGIKKNTYLNAGAIGYLATLGRTHVSTYAKPSITIIATGNELTSPGQPLEHGKIYESNTYMLQAALKSAGFDSAIRTVHDDYTATRNSIDKALKESDMLILTGGISVGDYDFVGEALHELGVENIFYKVRQKPGKPLYFGKTEDKLIFALPGNPAAALSCFYVYVLSALWQMMGNTHGKLKTVQLTLKSPYTKTSSMTHFLKAFMDESSVEILPAQSSAMLSSFVQANCIIIAEEGKTEWSTGESINVLILPS